MVLPDAFFTVTDGLCELPSHAYELLDRTIRLGRDIVLLLLTLPQFLQVVRTLPFLPGFALVVTVL